MVCLFVSSQRNGHTTQRMATQLSTRMSQRDRKNKGVHGPGGFRGKPRQGRTWDRAEQTRLRRPVELCHQTHPVDTWPREGFTCYVLGEGGNWGLDFGLSVPRLKSGLMRKSRKSESWQGVLCAWLAHAQDVRAA